MRVDALAVEDLASVVPAFRVFEEPLARILASRVYTISGSLGYERTRLRVPGGGVMRQQHPPRVSTGSR